MFPVSYNSDMMCLKCPFCDKYMRKIIQILNAATESETYLHKQNKLNIWCLNFQSKIYVSARHTAQTKGVNTQKHFFTEECMIHTRFNMHNRLSMYVKLKFVCVLAYIAFLCWLSLYSQFKGYQKQARPEEVTSDTHEMIGNNINRIIIFS